MSNPNFHPITGRKSETTIPQYIDVSLVSKTIGGLQYSCKWVVGVFKEISERLAQLGGREGLVPGSGDHNGGF